MTHFLKPRMRPLRKTPRSREGKEGSDTGKRRQIMITGKKVTNRFTFWNPAMEFKIGIGGLAIQLINNLTCKAFSTFSGKFRRKLKFKALFKAVM